MNTNLIEAITPAQVFVQHHQGVDILSVSNLLEFFEDGGMSFASFDDENEALTEWCRFWEADYYGAPRESFSLEAAVEQARENGYERIVVDDMS
jgi:hypothetical protein